MGEVYRARDTKLGRDVAIKILPRAFTTDPDRLARFEREARVLASLNHPNIGAIYGVEEGPAAGPAAFDAAQAGDAGHHVGEQVRALVLELVEGETLADRVRRGPVPVREALAIAGQIADALDAAHERGIVHRDLKPANIKITPAGVVKVLDFGLAKGGAAGMDEAGLASDSPTIGGTREGTILGTAPYMSPEQARGQAVDKRTDIWAFGCVLYEMLTGHVAFGGATVSDTIATILEREPDCAALPGNVPQAVRGLLHRCLEKDAKRRLRDIGDARVELDDSRASDAVSTAPATRGTRRRTLSWLGAAAGLAGVVAAVWAFSTNAVDRSFPITRTTMTLPANRELDTVGGAAPLALSPDGRRLAYVARRDGRAELYLRELDAFEPKPMTGTEGAAYPFFSPDGQWVAFFADGKLKRASVLGGAPVPICDAPVVGRGGTWAPDGTIVFDPGDSGLMRVAATGGSPEPLTSQDASMDARNLSWPQFLPDGRALLATVGPGLFAEEGQDALAVLTLDTGQWHMLGPGSQAQYLPSGHLVYHALGVREGELHVVGFDARQLALRGAPFSVLDSVFRARGGGAAYFAVAQSGALVYAPGGLAHTLVRVDRNGRRTPLSDDRRGFRLLRLSPDGRQLAVTIDPRPSQIWIYDIARGSRIPLATDGHNMSPAWTPDGKRVAYQSRGDIFWRTADASSAAERLLARDRPQYPASWSPDGRFLAFHDDHATNRTDIWILERDGDPRPLIATPASELNEKLSPDGRWIAFSSDESGRSEVYVRPFPNVDAGKWTVSTAGGHSPVWSPDGRELFYMSRAALMAVSVDIRGSSFVAGTPARLFDGPFDTTQNANYDIFPDGMTFVMVEADPDARPTRLQVIVNWSEELSQLASAN